MLSFVERATGNSAVAGFLRKAFDGLAGMLAVFAPGGLGVREGILMLILPLLVPRESAIIAALLLRLVMIAAELSLAGVSSALAARHGK